MDWVDKLNGVDFVVVTGSDSTARTFEYYFRDSLDTLVIHDLRNGYTWKTGTDLEFNKDIDDNCDDMIQTMHVCT